MKTALITGTSSGIGEAFAKTLLDLGWYVIGISRRQNIELEQHSNFTQITMDLSKPVDQLSLQKHLGTRTVNLLVNNAGTLKLTQSAEWDEDNYTRSVSVHYRAPLQLLALLRKNLSGGMVLSVLSTASHIGWDNYAYYGASKAALWLHMKSFAVGNPDITCISLHPSMVDTPITEIDSWKPAERKEFMTTTEMSRILTQLVTGVLSLPSGSSLFIANEWERSDLALFGEKTYFYNTDTDELKQLPNHAL